MMARFVFLSDYLLLAADHIGDVGCRSVGNKLFRDQRNLRDVLEPSQLGLGFPSLAINRIYLDSLAWRDLLLIPFATQPSRFYIGGKCYFGCF